MDVVGVKYNIKEDGSAPKNDAVVEISFKRIKRRGWHYVAYDSKTKQYIDPSRVPVTDYEIVRYIEVC